MRCESIVGDFESNPTGLCEYISKSVDSFYKGSEWVKILKKFTFALARG